MHSEQALIELGRIHLEEEEKVSVGASLKCVILHLKAGLTKDDHWARVHSEHAVWMLESIQSDLDKLTEKLNG
jgi:hypothetical protein